MNERPSVDRAGKPKDLNWVDIAHWNLKVFCEVAEQGSVTLAAKELAMTQPGVSNAIRRLEQRLGVQLVVREGMHLALTHAGAVFYEHALATVRSGRELDARLHGLKRGFGSSVTIGAMTAFSNHYLPPILAQFVREQPDVSLRVIDVPRQDSLELWFERGVEFAVLGRGGGVTGSAFVIEEIERVPQVLVAAPDHPLASHPHPTLAALTDVPIILGSRTSDRRVRFVERMRAVTDEEIQDTIEINGDAAISLVREGLGVALAPLFVVKQDIERGLLALIDVPGLDLYTDVLLVRRRSYALSPPAARLADLIRHNRPGNRKALTIADGKQWVYRPWMASTTTL